MVARIRTNLNIEASNDRCDEVALRRKGLTRRILSIDGGGIKGVFPASFLTAVEDSVGAPISRYFDLIVPCGIAGKRATSLERVLDRAVRADEVRPKLAKHFGELFERRMLHVSRAELEEKLHNHVQHTLAPSPGELLELKGSRA